MQRFATRPLRIGEQAIAAGEVVLIALAAANRDPRAFAAPDAFDVRRQGPAHLSFGYGAHYCLGPGLARMEAETALRGLARRFPGLRLTRPEEEPRWHGVLIARGLDDLSVEVGR